MKRATTFNLDQKMTDTIESLRVHYSLTTKAEVIRKAIAFLRLCAENQLPDGTLEIVGRQKQIIRVVL